MNVGQKIKIGSYGYRKTYDVTEITPLNDGTDDCTYSLLCDFDGDIITITSQELEEHLQDGDWKLV